MKSPKGLLQDAPLDARVEFDEPPGREVKVIGRRWICVAGFFFLGLWNSHLNNGEAWNKPEVSGVPGGNGIPMFERAGSDEQVVKRDHLSLA